MSHFTNQNKRHSFLFLPNLLSYFLIIIGIFLFQHNASATHNRAGEITYEQLDNLTIRATVTTYTKISGASANADRDTIEICWGDGTCEWLARANGIDADNDGFLDGEPIENDTRKNFYIGTHTYNGPAHYTISMQDPNRNGDILNVNPPNSDAIEFFIQTTATLFSGQFQGFNNSPVLLQPPVDIGCVGRDFIHNPNAFEVDGDSLSYELITPLRDINVQVPNYSFPNQINPGIQNQHSLNPVTGDFVWRSPQRAGEYNIAMRIIEHRNGVPIDTLIRDMQILIQNCENEPPEIETIDEICVIAGETISFLVTATDPDTDPVQQIRMSALGGPFEVNDPAIFGVPGEEEEFLDHPLLRQFIWQTTCEHISDQFYSVVFRVVDNGGSNGTGLSTLKTVRIKVVGPPPIDLQAEASTTSIDLNWENPYVCENAPNDYFRGFSIWRRSSSNQFEIDECEPGLDGKGYTRIAFGVTEASIDRYVYSDVDVERGQTYCYRILADFAQLSAGNFPFNLVESLASNEVCIQLGRDIPLITNVDVEATSTTNGEIEVRWSKPSPDDLDTIQNPGPYVYELQRTDGFSMTGFTPVAGGTFSSPTFANANDTIFLDSDLNTIDNPYTYQVAFYVNNESEPLGFTSTASSVFLTVAPTDEANLLSWEEEVPWENFKYTIFRRDPMGIDFIAIDTVEVPEYRDEGLINGEEYCYYILTEGSYGVDGVITPILNKSQQVCSVPEDNVPPCPPVLTVSNICDEADNSLSEDEFINNLIWTNPNNSCSETDDTETYQVFYTSTEGGEFDLIATIDTAEDTTYVHQPDLGIAGCYLVTAIDTVGNVSSNSNIVCVDNCPNYNLPNAFTPNDDGANDLFVPYPYRFIDRINLKIFNRWGALVFETTDPDINWNGQNLNNQDLAEGTYFYTCQVFENRVTGVVLSDITLTGYIELVRGR